MTVSASYTPSAELSTKVDVVENMLMDILLESSESVAMWFVWVLESYETKFTVDMNDRNLYIVQELMYDIKPMVHCVFNGGSYLTGVRECEDVDMAMCESVWGEFNECGSACRHEEEGSICTLQCVPFCDMMPGSDLADTSDMEDSVDMETEDDMEDNSCLFLLIDTSLNTYNYILKQCFLHYISKVLWSIPMYHS